MGDRSTCAEYNWGNQVRSILSVLEQLQMMYMVKHANTGSRAVVSQLCAAGYGPLTTSPTSPKARKQLMTKWPTFWPKRSASSK